MPDTPFSQTSPQSPPPDPLAKVQRERSMLLRFVRLGFFVLVVTVAMLLVLQQGDTAQSGEGAPIPAARRTNPAPEATPAPTPERETATASGPSAEQRLLTQIRDLLSHPRDGTTNSGQPGFTVAVNWYTILGAAIAFFFIVVLVDMVTPNKKIAAVSGVFLGTLTGILATVALSFVIDLVVRTWIPNERGLEAIRPILAAIKVMLGISLCYLAISTVMQTQDQFRLVIPYVEFTKQLRGVRPNLLDTSTLIDARIVEVAATGLLQSAIVIPRFVIAELQLLADSTDRLKRGRGRRGLDVVTRLQRMGTLDVLIDETPVESVGVDQMLVELAGKLGARIITTDLGLTRVAQIKGLTAINLHDLANTMRPALVPGEQISIRLVKAGEQPGQGVGYLDDGTMVVAEGGAPFIGSEVQLLVTSTMQTTAGRLVFARPSESATEHGGNGEPPAPSQSEAGAAVPPIHHPHPTHAHVPDDPASETRPSNTPVSRSGPPEPRPAPAPGPRRGASARNPRRWPPAAE